MLHKCAQKKKAIITLGNRHIIQLSIKISFQAAHALITLAYIHASCNRYYTILHIFQLSRLHCALQWNKQYSRIYTFARQTHSVQPQIVVTRVYVYIYMKGLISRKNDSRWPRLLELSRRGLRARWRIYPRLYAPLSLSLLLISPFYKSEAPQRW